jgi:hypothetical protein
MNPYESPSNTEPPKRRVPIIIQLILEQIFLCCLCFFILLGLVKFFEVLGFLAIDANGDPFFPWDK